MTVLFVCSACLENGSTDDCQSAREKARYAPRPGNGTLDGRPPAVARRSRMQSRLLFGVGAAVRARTDRHAPTAAPVNVRMAYRP